ncbi:hypothetical protein AAZX31_09G019900 [Glycine max]
MKNVENPPLFCSGRKFANHVCSQLEGFIKCNIVDAAMFNEFYTYGFCACLRNSEAHEAEDAALFHALTWITELDLHNVIVVIGCKFCRQLLNSSQNGMLLFIQRQANRVSHEFVRMSRFFTSHHVSHYIMYYIQSIIINEMI